MALMLLDVLYDSSYAKSNAFNYLAFEDVMNVEAFFRLSDHNTSSIIAIKGEKHHFFGGNDGDFHSLGKRLSD